MIVDTRVIAAWCLIVVGVPHADLGEPGQASGGQQRHVECASLGGLQLPNARITEAVAIAAPEKGDITVAHCRMLAEETERITTEATKETENRPW